jgi:hypothetical protein
MITTALINGFQLDTTPIIKKTTRDSVKKSFRFNLNNPPFCGILYIIPLKGGGALAPL